MAIDLIDELYKQPSENYPFGFEFANKLPDGLTLSSGTVTGKNIATGVTDNTVLQSTTATISGTQAKFRLQAGTDGASYNISLKVTLSDGSVLEEDLIMHVRERESNA